MRTLTRSDILLQAWDETYYRYGKQVIALLTEPHDAKVLNDINAASDLLDKRGDIYSSRPRFVVAYDTRCHFMSVLRPVAGTKSCLAGNAVSPPHTVNIGEDGAR